jgi:hypothetical protein
MKTVKGTLRMLGNSINRGLVVDYSVIEIDDLSLIHLRITAVLDNYLTRSFQQNEIVTLYIKKNLIAGIKTSDGKLLYTNVSVTGSVFLAILGIFPLGLVFGVGLLLTAYQCYLIISFLKMKMFFHDQGGIAT